MSVNVKCMARSSSGLGRQVLILQIMGSNPIRVTNMGNFLILIGALILNAGIVMNVFPNIKPPILPGDFYYHKDNMTVYFPIVTSIIISVVLTIILNLFK